MDNISITKIIILKNFFHKYKKRIIFLGLGAGLIYYLYKKFLSSHVNTMREIYSKISEFKEVMNLNSNFESLNEQMQISLNNLMPNLLEEIKKKIETEFSINKCFQAIQNAPKEELPKLWILFKNKALISFYCAVFVPRCLVILSQTHILVIEKMKKENLPKSFYENLLTDLWYLAVEFIEYIIKYIDNRLSPLVDNIILNHSYSKEKFNGEVRKFRERVEEIKFNKENQEIHLEIFQKYFESVKQKLNLLQLNHFTNDMKSLKISTFLQFYKIYYDIITSNLFQAIIIKALDYDFSLVETMIEMNFENEKKNENNFISVAKIASFINRMRTQILNPEHSILIIPNIKESKFPDELKEYFRIIYE